MKINIGRKFVISAVLTLIWAVVIFLFSAQNGEESSGTSGRVVSFLCALMHYSPSDGAREIMTFCVRKAAHMTEFGILALLLLSTLTQGFGAFALRYPAAFTIASAYAATDEIHQLFVGERAGQFTDWLIDSAGALLFLAAWWLLMKGIRFVGRRKTAESAKI